MEIPETLRELEDAGTVRAVTLGAVVSPVAGKLKGSPGYVRAVTSALLLNPSPSESRAARTLFMGI
jgi:hypothetical protein